MTHNFYPLQDVCCKNLGSNYFPASSNLSQTWNMIWLKNKVR